MNSETMNSTAHQKTGPSFFRPMHAFWALGFRPFFLLGSIWSLALMGIWTAFYLGYYPVEWSLSPILWHGHEMLYGFVTAIVAGFLLTASQNWTGKRGVHGLRLQFLVGAWFVARLFGLLPGPAALYLFALFDLAFYPLLILLLAPYLAGQNQKRNWIFLGLFTLLFAGNLMFHAESLELMAGGARKGLLLASYAFILMIVIIGGRVLPFFTRKVEPEAKITTRPVVNYLSLGTFGLFALSEIFAEGTPAVTTMATLAFLAHSWRWLTWDFAASLKRPILWILYVGYLWLIVGFLLKALSPVTAIPGTAAFHAFTAGAMGVVIYGMVSRVALGHTGRPIQASSLIVMGYILINLAAAVRVFGPIFTPDYMITSIGISGALWTLAFLLLVVYYWPILTRPRIDGRPG